MSQKLTLARYLEGRGAVKSLTRIEAEAFGVPYPLVSGWPARHGCTEITSAMLCRLDTLIHKAPRSSARKAMAVLDRVNNLPSGMRSEQRAEALEDEPKELIEKSAPEFIRRKAKSLRLRQARKIFATAKI